MNESTNVKAKHKHAVRDGTLAEREALFQFREEKEHSFYIMQ
jgi:hypothetical protein